MLFSANMRHISCSFDNVYICGYNITNPYPSKILWSRRHTGQSAYDDIFEKGRQVIFITIRYLLGMFILKENIHILLYGKELDFS